MSCLFHINFEDLEIRERCGSGTYGSVYRAYWSAKDREVAVKKLISLGNEVSYDMICIISSFRFIVKCVQSRPVD